MNPTYQVWCGIDVGKQHHHATAINADGQKIHDKPLPQDEKQLITLFERLSSHGRVLVIVDQPASIEALTITVARAEGINCRLPTRPCDATHRRPPPR